MTRFQFQGHMRMKSLYGSFNSLGKVWRQVNWRFHASCPQTPSLVTRPQELWNWQLGVCLALGDGCMSCTTCWLFVLYYVLVVCLVLCVGFVLYVGCLSCTVCWLFVLYCVLVVLYYVLVVCLVLCVGCLSCTMGCFFVLYCVLVVCLVLFWLSCTVC